jgi:carbonic anhydrase/acetyltransferase-like protein (isoleucine patch superfamily)
VGHHAIFHGCTIGDGALVGMGATVLNDAVIGENYLIGAGALITQGKSFSANMLIVGSPAKAVRELRPDEVAGVWQLRQGLCKSRGAIRDLGRTDRSIATRKDR